MKLVNLTDDRVINVELTDGSIKSIIRPKSVKPARIKTHQDVVREEDGVEYKITVVDEITGLPDPEPGTMYITSYLVAVYAQRSDVACPNQYPKESIRRNGETVLVRSLQVLV